MLFSRKQDRMQLKDDNSLHRMLVVTELIASGIMCKDPFTPSQSKTDQRKNKVIAFARCEWVLNIAHLIFFPVTCEI